MGETILFLFFLLADAAEKAKWGMYVGIGVVIVILIVAVFFIVRRCKARRSYQRTVNNPGTTSTVQPQSNTPLVNQPYPQQRPPAPIVYPPATGAYQTQPYEFPCM